MKIRDLDYSVLHKVSCVRNAHLLRDKNFVVLPNCECSSNLRKGIVSKGLEPVVHQTSSYHMRNGFLV